MDVIIAFVVFILIFGLVVFVHEFGHFWVAKKLGVVVEEFAFGFGPKVYAKKWRGTLYRINAIPLGGYVKMLGDQDGSSLARVRGQRMDAADLHKVFTLLREHGLDPKEVSYTELIEFLGKKNTLSNPEVDLIRYYISSEIIPNHPGNLDNKSIGARLAIVTAGVIMNFMLGILMFYGIFLATDFVTHLDKIGEPIMIGAEVSSPPILYRVYNQPDLPKDLAGIIMTVNGEQIDDHDQFANYLANNQNKALEIGLLGESEVYPVILSGDEVYSNHSDQIKNRVIITEVTPGSAAEKAKLENGDIFLTIAGEDIDSITTLRSVLAENRGKEVDIEIINSEGDKQTKKAELPNPEDEQPVLGVGLSTLDQYLEGVMRVSYLDNKLFSGIAHATNILVYNVTAFKEFASQSLAQKSIKPVSDNVGSIVAVFDITFSLVQIKDILNIVNLAAMLSVTLAFMNLLPIPLLDGGHVLFLFLEKLRGKPISDKKQENIGKVVFYILIILTILIITKDIAQYDWPTRIINNLSKIFQ